MGEGRAVSLELWIRVVDGTLVLVCGRDRERRWVCVKSSACVRAVCGVWSGGPSESEENPTEPYKK